MIVILFLNILLSLAETNNMENSQFVHADMLDFLSKKYDYQPEAYLLIVSPVTQQLYVTQNGKLKKTYTISTSKYGLGQQAGSYMTPLGPHIIKQKIGDGAEPGAVFRGRVFTGIIADIEHEAVETDLDYVTTRILWLEGLIEGFNKGAGIDSYKRYIYIHGTHEEGLIGKAASHGCIRMKNNDVISLYNLVPEGTFVYVLNDENKMVEEGSPQHENLIIVD